MISTYRWIKKSPVEKMIDECNDNELHLCSCSLDVVPVCLLDKTNITNLDLSRNSISMLPTGMENLTNLRTLSLHSNAFSKWPNPINFPSSLTGLDMGGNPLTETTIFLDNMTNLAILRIANNMAKAIEINSFSGSVAQLRELDLHNSVMPIIAPGIISRLVNLETLNLASTGTKTLPIIEMRCLTNLTCINLHGNGLYAFPVGLIHCTSLRTLILSRNSLHELPPKLFSHHLTNLVDITLTENRLADSLRDMVFDLPSLRMLLLGENSLTSLPIMSPRTTNVKHVSLRYNQLTRIPSYFAKPLANTIEVLDIDSNRNLTTVALELAFTPNMDKPFFEECDDSAFDQIYGDGYREFNYFNKIDTYTIKPLLLGRVLCYKENALAIILLFEHCFHIITHSSSCCDEGGGGGGGGIEYDPAIRRVHIMPFIIKSLLEDVCKTMSCETNIAITLLIGD